MFRSGICPYCSSIIEYKKRADAMKEGSYICRRCKKKSQVLYKKSGICLGLIFAAALIALNILMLSKGHSQTIIPNFVVTVIAIIIYLTLLPVTTNFIKIKEEEEQQKLKKNRHRHKRSKRKESAE